MGCATYRYRFQHIEDRYFLYRAGNVYKFEFPNFWLDLYFKWDILNETEQTFEKGADNGNKGSRGQATHYQKIVNSTDAAKMMLPGTSSGADRNNKA